MNILTFFALQLDKLKAKSPNHAAGPRKPTLAQLESGNQK